jgi:hypothetical protein
MTGKIYRRSYAYKVSQTGHRAESIPWICAFAYINMNETADQQRFSKSNSAWYKILQPLHPHILHSIIVGPLIPPMFLDQFAYNNIS